METRDPDNARRLYLKRTAWLFVFGAIHACVFWTGDVLHMYAFFGLMLLLLRRAPERLIWTLFVACIQYMPVSNTIRLLITTPDDVKRLVDTFHLREASNNAAYGHGTFLDAAREHTREMIFWYTDPNGLRSFASFSVQVFTTTLLGLVLGRRSFFQRSADYLPLVRRVQWWALAAGIATGVVHGIYEQTRTKPGPSAFGVVASTGYVLCRLGVMTFYVATIVRCVHNETWRRRLAPMGVVGRMPLSNYLLQTLIGTTLFYGWGFSLWGKVGPALDLVLSVAIFFLVQMPLSHYWLKRHDMGPMEYLWRILTYGRGALRQRAVAISNAA